VQELGSVPFKMICQTESAKGHQLLRVYLDFPCWHNPDMLGRSDDVCC
jgi:hypothetical protein